VSDNTDSGKTYTTLKLLEIFAKQGLKVGAIKPIETGVTKIPEDGLKLYKKCKSLNDNFKEITLKDVVPITFKLPAAPFVAKQSKKINFDKIKKSLQKIEKVSDIVLIESAGGIMTPIEKNFFVLDFANMFNARVLFINHSKLGMLSALLTNLKFLKQKNIDFVWGINVVNKKEFKKFNKKFLDFYFKD
jgi:dethiobiotin synthetase